MVLFTTRTRLTGLRTFTLLQTPQSQFVTYIISIRGIVAYITLRARPFLTGGLLFLLHPFVCRNSIEQSSALAMFKKTKAFRAARKSNRPLISSVLREVGLGT